MGIAGFFLPKLVSKRNPSSAMKANCENVIIFPEPGYSLKQNLQVHISNVYPT